MAREPPFGNDTPQTQLDTLHSEYGARSPAPQFAPASPIWDDWIHSSPPNTHTRESSEAYRATRENTVTVYEQQIPPEACYPPLSPPAVVHGHAAPGTTPNDNGQQQTLHYAGILGWQRELLTEKRQNRLEDYCTPGKVQSNCKFSESESEDISCAWANLCKAQEDWVREKDVDQRDSMPYGRWLAFRQEALEVHLKGVGDESDTLKAWHAVLEKHGFLSYASQWAKRRHQVRKLYGPPATSSTFAADVLVSETAK